MLIANGRISLSFLPPKSAGLSRETTGSITKPVEFTITLHAHVKTNRHKERLSGQFKSKFAGELLQLDSITGFDLYLQRKGIVHYFSYPRTPKSNAFIERFNRTIQEEFVDANTEYLKDTKDFNRKPIDYLPYYNTVRLHQSLGYLTPMAYMLERDLKSKMYWTSTETVE